MMLLTALPGIGHERLTEAEAESWLKSITMDELVGFVIRYDYVEHTKPEISMPEYTVFETRNELILNPAGSMEVEIGHLRYSVDLPEKRIEWESERKRCIIPALLGAVIGAGAISAAIIILD